MHCPDDRCGFTATEEDIPSNTIDREYYHPTKETCCWRPNWREYDRCIWHARTDGKPVSELVESRTRHPERLDGSYLCNLDLTSVDISFQGCTLHYSVFDGSNLEGLRLKDVICYFASFREVQMSNANLEDAIFSMVDFSDSNMQILWAREASFTECDLSKSIVGGDFRHADITNSDFSKSEKGMCDFSYARVIGSDFSKSFLPRVIFKLSDAMYNDFSDSEIGRGRLMLSNMDKCNFQNSTIHDCFAYATALEESDFSRATIRRCEFVETDLYGCIFENVRLDRDTSIKGIYIGSDRPDKNILERIDVGINEMWDRHVLERGGEDDDRLLEKRMWTYETLQNLSKINSLSRQARQFYLLKKESQREYSLAKRSWVKWISLSASKTFMGYAEKPLRLVVWSGFIILAFGLIYSLSGGVEGAELDTALPFEAPLNSFFESVYFSSMTFTNLGYGDLQPSTWTVRTLATIQSFLGILLTALLVFVLGRRTTW